MLGEQEGNPRTGFKACALSTSLETEEEKMGVDERCFQNCKKYIVVEKNLKTIQLVFFHINGGQGPKKATDWLKIAGKRAYPNFNTTFIFSEQELS